jgi:hypothetical protein
VPVTCRGQLSGTAAPPHPAPNQADSGGAGPGRPGSLTDSSQHCQADSDSEADSDRHGRLGQPCGGRRAPRLQPTGTVTAGAVTRRRRDIAKLNTSSRPSGLPVRHGRPRSARTGGRVSHSPLQVQFPAPKVAQVASASAPGARAPATGPAGRRRNARRRMMTPVNPGLSPAESGPSPLSHRCTLARSRAATVTVTAGP